MSNLDSLILRGHQKVIDHYRRLRDSALSEAERELFQRRIDEEERLLRDFTEKAAYPSRRVA